MQKHPQPIRSRRWRFLAVVAGALLATGPTFAQIPAVDTPALLVPRNLSYWAMFTHATAVVKLVMILLFAASIATWSVWLSKFMELRVARHRLDADVRRFSADVASSDENSGASHPGIAEMLRVSAMEAPRAGATRSVAAIESAKDRITVRLFAVENRVAERMLRGTSVLATVGATAPFVGLFGTVWGIMNSFISISQSNTTNLAVVAPGIAEALLATAMGLVAAIPAVVMYNHVARAVSGIRRQLSEAAAGIACLRSQELDAELTREPVVQAA